MTTFAIKLSVQGWLVYATITVYLLAFALRLLRQRATAWWVYGAGFAVAIASVVYRGLDVQHLPMQSMFEIFLVLAMLMFPLSLFSRYALRIGYVSTDMLLGIAILFPAGFIFSDQPQQLPPALQSQLFLPHVAAYLAAYVIMAKAVIVAFDLLFRGPVVANEALAPRDRAVDRLVRFGFPLMTLGLILGAVWGHRAFGEYWQWDPKEMLSLATWLTFVAYLHLRLTAARKYVKLAAGVVIIGGILMLVTLFWSHLQPLAESLMGTTIDSYHTYSG
jgi:ABC-type transport system involved in cytochrome c biogenesis permease subunit